MFLRCLAAFPQRAELLRNMLGLMGNVAEVDYLRPRLMHRQYVEIFRSAADDLLYLAAATTAAAAA